MTRFRKLLGLATATAVGAMALGAGAAAAHTVSFGTDSTLGLADYETPTFPEDYPDRFEGWVDSSRAACEPNRRVRVFRRVDGPDDFLGSDLSEDDGTANPGAYWSVGPVEDPGNGTYYAKVGRRFLSNTSAHQHVCSRGRSPNVLIYDT